MVIGENSKLNEEIKIRAWDKVSRKMYVPSLLITINGVLFPAVITTKNKKVDYYDQSTVALSLSSGERDKNGKDIYQGDIVKWKQASGGKLPPEPDTYICEILRDGVEFVCQIVGGTLRFTFSGGHIEVIGNIYENPELTNKQNH